MDNNKKEKELNILNKLFRNEVNIRKCEQPDFILTYGELVSYSVEITEFYYNSASARLKNKNGYIKDLIEHQKYIHKDDKKLLKVHEIKYYSQMQPNNPINMNALFFPKFRMENLRHVLLNLLKQKNIMPPNVKTNIF